MDQPEEVTSALCRDYGRPRGCARGTSCRFVHAAAGPLALEPAKAQQGGTAPPDPATLSRGGRRRRRAARGEPDSPLISGYRAARDQMLKLQTQSSRLRATYAALNDDELARKADQVDAELRTLLDQVNALNAAIRGAFDRLGSRRETEKKAGAKKADPTPGSPPGP